MSGTRLRRKAVACVNRVDCREWRRSYGWCESVLAEQAVIADYCIVILEKLQQLEAMAGAESQVEEHSI